MLASLNTLARTALLLGVVLLAGWWTLFLRGRLGAHERQLAEREERIAVLQDELDDGRERIAALGRDLDAERERVRELEAARRLLKVDHRVARIDVLSQTEPEPGEGGDEAVRTRLRFTELGPGGEPLGEGTELEVRGRRVYLESLVVKFEDDFVEAGDFLRGTSVCLFRRAFGEDEAPAAGAPIDAAGRLPRIYAGDDDPDPFFDELWASFWDYANDPEAARALGVRAIHGEAPFVELRPGRSYRVELRASGGLTIRPEDPPR